MKDEIKVGKVLKNGKVCVTEKRIMCNGSQSIKRYSYDLRTNVKKVFSNQIEEDEELMVPR